MADKYHTGAARPLPKVQIRVGVSTSGSVRWEFRQPARGIEWTDEEFRAIVAHTIRMLDDVRGKKIFPVAALPEKSSGA